MRLDIGAVKNNRIKSNNILKLKNMREELDYIEDLRSMTKSEIHWFIRGNLIKEGKKIRFEMSGYDGSSRGSCTIHNQKVLNTFAYLGIYDHTHFLCLDFYQGSPSIALMYLGGDRLMYGEDLNGYSTTEIIYKIFELTILSNKTKRIRG